MTLYVMDTDHLSLIERGHLPIRSRLLSAQNNLDDVCTTVVTVEEQLAGRIARIRRIKEPQKLIYAYERLRRTYQLLSGLKILDYSVEADDSFRLFRKAGIRIGTQDLRIASIVLANEGVLVTRNRRDFEKVPGLRIQDWSVEP